MNTVNFNALGPIYYSGNLPDVIITASEELDITIKLEREHRPDFEITEKYFPESSGVKLRIRNLIHNELFNSDLALGSFGIPDLNYVEQFDATGKVTITAVGEEFSETSKDFRVVKGALDVWHGYNFTDFFNEMPLSLCPKIRKVKLNEPTLISYYSAAAYSVNIAAAEPLNKVPHNIKTLYTASTANNQLHTINAMLSKLIDVLEESYKFIYFSINSNWEKAIILQLIEDGSQQHDDFFAFESSIGGIDTLRLSGVLFESPEHEYLAAVKEGKTLEYDTVPKTVYEKNTGIIATPEHSRWIMDFFASHRKYHYHNNQWKRIYIIETDAQYAKERINSFTFQFAYANPSVGRLLIRENLQW